MMHNNERRRDRADPRSTSPTATSLKPQALSSPRCLLTLVLVVAVAVLLAAEA